MVKKGDVFVAGGHTWDVISVRWVENPFIGGFYRARLKCRTNGMRMTSRGYVHYKPVAFALLTDDRNGLRGDWIKKETNERPTSNSG